jgi:hypothetical protein
MKNTLLNIWLPIVFVGTVVLLAAYIGIQQDLRQSANDPQIQLAEDGAVFLSKGLSAANLLGSIQINPATSLQVFGLVYDQNGKLLGSSMVLGSTTPVIPAGILTYALTHKDDRVTWQPAPGVRIAAVVKHFSGPTSSGFLVVGRSVREVELRESSLGTMMLAAWLVMTVGTLGWFVGIKKWVENVK